MTETEPALKTGEPPADFYDPSDGDNSCFLCGQPRYRLLYEIRQFGFPFRFKICQCGLIKQTPLPNKRFFEWFFNSEVFYSSRKAGKEEIWGYYDYFSDESSRLKTSNRRFRALARYFPSDRKLEILKIGPSTGTFLHVASRHGHRAIGCDISSEFIEYASRNYGVRIDRGRFEDLPYEKAQFDVILLFNVIENVPNQEEFLRRVNFCLKPGGLFILNYVDMARNLVAAFQRDRYFLYRPPVCYMFFRSVMEQALGKFGFVPVSRLRDIRFMHLEKLSTLLHWRWLLALARGLRISRFDFPVYAYPSKIVVSRKGREV